MTTKSKETYVSNINDVICIYRISNSVHKHANIPSYYLWTIDDILNENFQERLDCILRLDEVYN